ncbi:MAG: putative serine/threonine-protein kinase pknH [Labilithrix sp.]|nr:putative serine/threonine-protein kinase pknH [Labilithrix sp.]
MSSRLFAMSFGLATLAGVVALSTLSIACSSSSTSTAGAAADGGAATDDGATGDGGSAPSCGPEVDLQSDPTSCGSCGHSCRGSACSGGVCAEQVVASGGLDPVIAVDDSNVYFSLPLDGSAASLQRAPKNGGATVPLVNTGYVASMAIGGGRLVWATKESNSGGSLDDVVDSCALPGCASAMNAFAADNQRRSFFVAADASRMFWIVGQSAGRGAVESCPITGCADAPTSIAPPTGGSGTSARIAVTKNDVFWALSNGSLAHCPKSGGCDAATAAIADTAGVLALAADAANAYFWTKSGLFSCAAPDCAGGPKKLTTFAGFADAVWLATDGTDVFFAQGVGGVSACPITGCTGSPRIVSSSGPPKTGNLVVDDAFVYYVSSTSNPRQLVRVAK